MLNSVMIYQNITLTCNLRMNILYGKVIENDKLFYMYLLERLISNRMCIVWLKFAIHGLLDTYFVIRNYSNLWYQLPMYDCNENTKLNINILYDDRNDNLLISCLLSLCHCFWNSCKHMQKLICSIQWI